MPNANMIPCPACGALMEFLPVEAADYCHQCNTTRPGPDPAEPEFKALKQYSRWLRQEWQAKRQDDSAYQAAMQLDNLLSLVGTLQAEKGRSRSHGEYQLGEEVKALRHALETVRDGTLCIGLTLCHVDGNCLHCTAVAALNYHKLKAAKAAYKAQRPALEDLIKDAQVQP